MVFTVEFKLFLEFTSVKRFLLAAENDSSLKESGGDLPGTVASSSLGPWFAVVESRKNHLYRSRNTTNLS